MRTHRTMHCALGESLEVGRWHVRGALLAALACGVLAACDDPAPIPEHERMAAEATALELPEPLALPPLSEGVVRDRPKGASGAPVFYLRIETDAARRLRFRCDTVTLVGCALALFDADGARLSFGGTEPHVMRTDFYVRLPAPGTYYLGVSGFEGSSGTFRYQLINLGIDPVADRADEATPIEPGQTIDDPLQGAGDVDAYTFEVSAGRAYRIECTAPESARHWSFHFAVPGMSAPQVYGGSRIVHSSTYRATQDGTGSVIVETPVGSAPADTSISFSCHLVELIDDAPDTLTGPARALPIDTEVSGASQWPGDVDVFATILPARHHLTVVVDCNLGYCPVEVYDPSGARQPSVPAPYHTALWTSLTAGEYRVRVTASSGTYRLRVSDLGADDVGNVTSEATTVTIEAPLVGRIGATWDVDVFLVEAPAGQTLDLSCITTGVGWGGVRMYLTDTDGRALINRFVDVTTTQDGLTVPASGRLYATFSGSQWVRDYRCEWTVRTAP